MKNKHKSTPMLPGFHIQTLRRKKRSAQQILAEKIALEQQKSLAQLSTCFSRFIPDYLLKQNSTGTHSRNRIYSKKNTFWAFFSQVLDADGGCSEVVKKLKAFAVLKNFPSKISVSTGSYCKARSKLSEDDLNLVFKHTVKQMSQLSKKELFHDKRVIVVDATGLSMPDTPLNQKVWPQQKQQKPGCGFPTATVCACFSLGNGSLLSYALGSKHDQERTLFRKQRDLFKKGDILLGDKGFCSYYDIAKLNDRGVDSVLTLSIRKPIKQSKCIKKFGDNDLLVEWQKPNWHKNAAYTRKDWESLPERLLLRQIKVKVNQPGFRVKEFYIITTLNDSDMYPANDIGELYFKRWQVELYFRDIKTTMGMDILRCKSPEMIRKEILMNFIVYNALRRLIHETVVKKQKEYTDVSFKSAVQSLRQWEPYLDNKQLNKQKRHRLLNELYDSIVGQLIVKRPGRREPRCLKRRPKPYQLLTKHRHEMKEIEHKSRYRAKVS